MHHQKSEPELTREIIRMLAPKGVKGIETLTKDWGQILLKVHHQDQQELMDSLFFACTKVEDYLKAFHLFLQYFYHYDLLEKEDIILWVKASTS